MMDSDKNWPDRRLERFEAEARATGSVEAWRRLRNLAAACGRLELARMAHERWMEFVRPVEEKSPLRHALPPKNALYGVGGRAGASVLGSDRMSQNAAGTASPSAAAPIEVRLRIRSAMPLARAAWLARWAAARGGSARQGDSPDRILLSLPGGRGELDRLLAAQSELALEAE
jgi:hypothetical protein